MRNIIRIYIRSHIIALLFGLGFGFGFAPANAQILQDSASLSLVKKGVDSIYNMQFNYAEDVYNKIRKLHPDSPLVIFYKGLIAYWKNYPLLPNSSSSIQFENEMHSCINLCEERNTRYESEYLLANLCARGLLINYYSNNGLTNEVFPLALSTYKYIRKSFDFAKSSPDFCFFTGLYNYYREVYPKIHPFYKPLAMLLTKGDRIKGLEQLQTASQNSILLKAEAYSDLAYIWISYENNYVEALYFNRYLHDLYPNNPEYFAEYIKNLLLLRQYDEAEKQISKSEEQVNNTYYNAQVFIFKGLIQEKKYHNNTLAEEYYNTGIRDINAFGEFGNEFAAYAYFGLSRISSLNGNKEKSKFYRKFANKLAVSKKINFD